MIKVENNFLNNTEFNYILDVVTSDKFPWYLQKYKVFQGDNQIQFTHNLVNKINNKTQSSFFVSVFLSELLKKLNATHVLKAKINLTPKTDKILETPPHTDIDNIDLNNPSMTAILYMNTNNGYTQIVGGNKVPSVENRLLTFPTNTSHFGTTHTDTDYRIVLNVVYK